LSSRERRRGEEGATGGIKSYRGKRELCGESYKGAIIIQGRESYMR
jgi:hypothetical protein